jgi:hypothetical protein
VSARTADTLFVELSLENMAGHKFPTGFPSRRAFVELFALNEVGDTLFHSGKMDNNFNLVGEDIDFESHYDIIKEENEIQIYEMVMGDVTFSPTTVLERAYVHLKDNRLPPVGFTSVHYSYDTVQIVGNAFDDPDFNKENGNEGSGKDIVKYHIPIGGEPGSIGVKAMVYYQTVTNKWLEHMFGYSSDAINAFEEYYNDADKTPVKVGEVDLISMVTGNTHPHDEKKIILYPNPARDYIFVSFQNKISGIRFYSLKGELISNVSYSNELNVCSDVPKIKGVYMVQVISEEGVLHFEKVIVN